MCGVLEKPSENNNGHVVVGIAAFTLPLAYLLPYDIRVKSIKPHPHEQIFCGNFYLPLYMRKFARILCDKFIC